MGDTRTRAVIAAAFGVGLSLALGSCERAHNDSRGHERRQQNEESQFAAEFGKELPGIAFEVGYQLGVIDHSDEDGFDSAHRLRSLADRLSELQGRGLDEDDRRRRRELIEEAYFGYPFREFVEQERARNGIPETRIARSFEEVANCFDWVAGKRVPTPWSESECRELVAEERRRESGRRARVGDEAVALVHEVCKSLYSWTSREHAEQLVYREAYSELRPGQLRQQFEEGGGLGGASREAGAATVDVVEAGVSELLRSIDGEYNPDLDAWSSRETWSMGCLSAAGHMTTPRDRMGLPKRYRELLDERDWPRSWITLSELRELRLDELAQ